MTDLIIDDLQALVSGNQIKMMSVAEGLLYDVTITSISENTFTGDVEIYRDGVQLPSAVVSGMITEGSSITGALTGEGSGNGTFDLVYSMHNGQMADLSRIDDTNIGLRWNISNNFICTICDFDIGSDGVMNFDAIFFEPLFDGCSIENGVITAITGTSLYSVDLTLANCNTDSAIDGVYTGLAIDRFDIQPDALLVTAISNGAYAIYGDFVQD
jgi:hypothetical protein